MLLWQFFFIILDEVDHMVLPFCRRRMILIRNFIQHIVVFIYDIDNMLYYKYGQGYTFSTLALLYPNLDLRNKFHIDHIHPQSLFTRAKLRKRGVPDDEIAFFLDNVNTLSNLQILEGVPNQEKGDTNFATWLEKKYPSPDARMDYMKRHLIPGVDLSLLNFREFIEGRKSLMREELLKHLKV